MALLYRKIIGISEGLTFVKFDDNETEIVKEIVENYVLQNCTLRTSLTYFRIEGIDDDIRLNGWGISTDIREYRGGDNLLESIDFFYHINGRFPPGKELVPAPDGDMTEFLEESKKVSKKHLYKLYRRINLHSLVSAHFFSSLNVYLGGKRKISNNAKLKFYQNCLMQVLSGKNLSVT